MGARVFFGALVGSILMFAAGAAEHMLLHWVDRQIKNPVDPTTLKEDFRKHFPAEGVYTALPFPGDMANLTKEQKDAFNEAYKQGPAGLVFVAPTGQDIMGPMQFGGEFATNFLCALLA